MTSELESAIWKGVEGWSTKRTCHVLNVLSFYNSPMLYVDVGWIACENLDWKLVRGEMGKRGNLDTNSVHMTCDMF
jgi:hypothetical protein